MNHRDHLHLISKAISTPEGVWADLGSGDGAFTLALADATDQKSVIYSVDQDPDRLKRQKELFGRNFSKTTISFINQDFTNELNLPPLDGVIMANSLHYVKDQTTFLQKLRGYLKPTGVLIIVEYNSDHENRWVPYPTSFEKLQTISAKSGYTPPQLLNTIPSYFMNEIYAASLHR